MATSSGKCAQSTRPFIHSKNLRRRSILLNSKNQIGSLVAYQTTQSLHKHAVAVGVEAVALLDRMAVGAENVFFSSQRADQH